MNTCKSTLLLVFLAVLVASCAAPTRVMHYPVNPSNPIKRVAILPMLDNVGDVDAPGRMREAFFNRLGGAHYDIQPLAETSEILNLQMGITLGKQLGTATPQQIGNTLGVDGLFYGYLINFDEITVGVSNIYKVRIGWKLVDTQTGQIVWGRGIGVRRTTSVGGIAGLVSGAAEAVQALPSANEPMKEMPGLDRWISMGDHSVELTENLIEGLAVRVVGSLSGRRLENEINFAYDRLFTHMLAGPVVK